MRDALRTPLGRLTVALTIVVIGVLVFGWLAYQNAIERSDQIIAQSDRGDCRSEINSWIAAVDRRAASLDRSLSQQRAAGELASVAGQRPSQEAIDRYSKTEGLLERANRADDALPNLQDAVDHGWTPSDDARAVVPALPARLKPCPTVG